MNRDKINYKYKYLKYKKKYHDAKIGGLFNDFARECFICKKNTNCTKIMVNGQIQYVCCSICYNTTGSGSHTEMCNKIINQDGKTTSVFKIV